MSLFDFLTQNPNVLKAPDYSGAIDGPQPQQASAPMAPPPPAAPTGLLAAPQQEEDTPAPVHPQGLLSRFSAPDPTGVSMADRIFAIGSILKGDSEGGMKYLTTKAALAAKAKDAAEKQALKEKGNRAFRAAYQNGKFDAGTYASVMGEDLDPMDFAKLATAAGPKGGESGGFAMTTNPLNGQVEWGGQRPPSYADTTSYNTEAERERHDKVTETQGAGHLAVAQGNAGLAAQRERRLASKPAGGGASWLPPGAKIVHLPGS
jgi:hypothetical protein